VDLTNQEPTNITILLQYRTSKSLSGNCEATLCILCQLMWMIYEPVSCVRCLRDFQEERVNLSPISSNSVQQALEIFFFLFLMFSKIKIILINSSTNCQATAL
jgi:hypothetical protein